MNILYRILIVDDVKLNRRLISSVLSTLDSVEFSEAEDGFKAMEKLESEPVDLMILDLMMPGKNGYQVLSEMKTNDEFKNIPVIVYSAMDDIDSVRQALDLGAYDYFSKPLTPQQMKVVVPIKVRNALENYSQKRQLIEVHEKMQLEMMLANVFQSMLMAEAKQFPHIAMYGRYLPCNEIGGDFYDCVEHGDDIWFIMADISGHGVTAAMMASMVKMEFSHCIQTASSPAEVLSKMNQSFCQVVKGSQFLTAFVGLIQKDQFTWANGGHPYPLYYEAKGDTAGCLRQHGNAIGLFPEATYQDVTQKFSPGDMILLYTDGLLDAKVIDDEQNTCDDLQRYFMSYKYLLQSNPQGFFDTILNLVGNVQNRTARDDIALMILQRKE